MSDLESSLLKAALDFARARAEELLDNLIADALALLREVVPVPTPAQLAAVNAIEPAVATDLSTAKNDVVAFGTQLAAAADLSAIEAAFASLSAALTAVDAAIEKVTTAAGVPAAGVLGGLVKKAVAAVGDEFSGLIEQRTQRRLHFQRKGHQLPTGQCRRPADSAGTGGNADAVGHHADGQPGLFRPAAVAETGHRARRQPGLGRIRPAADRGVGRCHDHADRHRGHR
jgi:hypothetical protein